MPHDPSIASEPTTPTAEERVAEVERILADFATWAGFKEWDWKVSNEKVAIVEHGLLHPDYDEGREREFLVMVLSHESIYAHAELYTYGGPVGSMAYRATPRAIAPRFATLPIGELRHLVIAKVLDRGSVPK